VKPASKAAAAYAAKAAASTAMQPLSKAPGRAAKTAPGWR
jgi:hypothetical protein